MRMNLSLFMTIYVSSILFLLVFHLIFLGLWYIGLVSRVAGKRPEFLTIFQNCAVSIIAKATSCIQHLNSYYMLICATVYDV